MKFEYNSDFIKRILSISLKELLTQKSFKDLEVLNWYDRVGSDHGARHCKKSPKEPFTGVMILNASNDENELSKSCLLEGHHLGPEIFASTYRSFFGDGQHGLDISLNVNSYYHKPQPKIENLIGSNPSPPENISLWIFGVEFYDQWYRNKHASKFSVKFYDHFIKETLTQKNLIEAFERDISEDMQRMHSNKAFRIFSYAHQLCIKHELLSLFKSIKNFDQFLDDEMIRLKDEFKGFKSINSIYDSINLIFIFNPLFKEVIESMYKEYYFGDALKWYGEIDSATQSQLDEVIKKQVK